MQEHKSFLIRDLLGDVLTDRVQGNVRELYVRDRLRFLFFKYTYFCKQ